MLQGHSQTLVCRRKRPGLSARPNILLYVRTSFIQEVRWELLFFLFQVNKLSCSTTGIGKVQEQTEGLVRSLIGKCWLAAESTYCEFGAL